MCLMAQGKNMNPVEPPGPPQMQNMDPQQIRTLRYRTAMRKRIFTVLQEKIPSLNDATIREKCFKVTLMIEERLYKAAKSLEEYCDVRNLHVRITSIFQELQRITSEQRLAKISKDQSVAPTPEMGNTNLAAPTFQSGSLPPVYCTTGGSSFNGCQQVSAGYPISSGNTTMPVFNTNNDGGNLSVIMSEPQRQQTASGSYHMAGGFRPNLHQVTSGICTPQTVGFGIGTSSVPSTSYELLNSTYMPTLATPLVQRNNVAGSFGPNNYYGVVPSSVSMTVARDTMPLNLNRVDPTCTSNQLNMQQAPLLNRQQLHQQRQSASNINGDLAQVTQQRLNHGNVAQARQQHLNDGFYQQARDIDQQGQQHLNHGFYQQTRDSHHQGQHSQQLYSGQLQKQDQWLNVDAYQTQLATRVVTPIKHEPSLHSCKEGLQQQAMNGFKPSELQYQPNAAQSASTHSNQLNPSPLPRTHAEQKQLASVMVQRQSSLPSSPQISKNNNGINLCQRAPMQPEAGYSCSSAKAPISSQTVSPRSTAESKSVVRDTIRWLLFMFHGRDCTATKCDSKHCPSIKELLKHMQHCKDPACTYRFCSQTRELLDHYFKKCKDKSCPVCVFVKKYKEKERMLHLCKAKCQPRESSESLQSYNKRGADVPSEDDDLQPPVKRLKVEQSSQKATFEKDNNSVSVRDVVLKSHPSVTKQEEDGLQSVKFEAMPMDTDVSDTSRIPVTKELEKHVVEDTPEDKDGELFALDDKTTSLSAQGESRDMNEMNAPKEESVKQSVNVVDAPEMEVSSLVELFTPEQVKEHVRGLRQWVGQSKTKAEKNKALGHSMSVNSCQLCAVEKLVFEPIPIYCSPCGVRIKRNAFHYSVAAGESRHYVCTPCYNGVHENFVSLGGYSIPKARLEKKKNDEQIEEGWVQCDKCQAWQHQICALFNGRRNHGEETKYACPSCYVQEVEEEERKPLPESAIPGAKSLPVTNLSNHIEQRLFKTLKKEREERARLQGKNYDEVPGVESLAVRVVASVDKVLEVKQHFLELFREENYPSEFPYKSKAILLFQKIESVEVCIFGMFVQEFGTECGPPNQRRVYLSYLDSVKYFRPEIRTVSGEALRTFVYHEILIGYLDYCKKRGFTSCYIWACPPLKGEDYILYCHPEIQKTPRTDKLREWYLAMLRKASKEDVVVECTNLYDQFFVQSGECRANVTAARLPYFDGDYWPGAAEDLIHQMSQEADGTKLNRKGSTKKAISKRALRAVGQLDLSVNASKDRLTMQKLGEIICPLKEDFIMVHLQHSCKHCCNFMVSGNRWVCKQCKNFQICDKCNEAEQNRVDEERHPIYQKEKHTLFPVAIKDVPAETEDKDNNIESEFFDNRQAFLSLCQGNNYQYDTLRRAKHSSMMLLYHLHNPTVSAFATTCTICQQEVENSQGWHCGACPGYDVCNACYSKASVDHAHNLISRSSAKANAVQQNGQANQNYQFQLEKLRELLLHVTSCRTGDCSYQGCRKIKMTFKHCLACKLGIGDCPTCKSFWTCIKRHAQNCRDSKCAVPKCRDFRALLSKQQQQLEQRRRAAVMEMMRERAAETKHTS